MKDTQEVASKLGISRQWLTQLIKILKIKPKQKIVGGRTKNFFSADQVRELRVTVGL